MSVTLLQGLILALIVFAFAWDARDGNASLYSILLSSVLLQGLYWEIGNLVWKPEQ